MIAITCSVTAFYKIKFKDFQGPCLFSRTFQALKIWKKFKDFQGPATALSLVHLLILQQVEEATGWSISACQFTSLDCLLWSSLPRTPCQAQYWVKVSSTMHRVTQLFSFWLYLTSKLHSKWRRIQTLGYDKVKWLSRLVSNSGSTPIRGFKIDTPGRSSTIDWWSATLYIFTRLQQHISTTTHINQSILTHSTTRYEQIRGHNGTGSAFTYTVVNVKQIQQEAVWFSLHIKVLKSMADLGLYDGQNNT